jgi:hypothetical protein
MNLIQKIKRGLFILLVLTGCSTGQDSLTILNESWVKLKTQLKRRSDIALTLLPSTIESGSPDKTAIDMIKTGVANFHQFIDSSNTLDSVTVQLVKKKTVESTQLISKAMNLRMGDSSFSKKDFENLQAELEAAENRISVAKKYFNGLCVQFKRPGLVFK